MQVVDDMDSDPESIEMLGETNLMEINGDIEEIEKKELNIKRQKNVYDLMGLQNPTHIHYKEIN